MGLLSTVSPCLEFRKINGICSVSCKVVCIALMAFSNTDVVSFLEKEKVDL